VREAVFRIAVVVREPFIRVLVFSRYVECCLEVLEARMQVLVNALVEIVVPPSQVILQRGCQLFRVRLACSCARCCFRGVAPFGLQCCLIVQVRVIVYRSRVISDLDLRV
jgi:hypothetical protein